MFSYIIISHNQKNILAKQLRSIFLQKRKNDEIIIIDDNSNENYTDIIQYLDMNYIKITHTNNNRSYARNLGAKIAKNDYLIFLDGDILLPKSNRKSIKYTISKCKKSILFLNREESELNCNIKHDCRASNKAIQKAKENGIYINFITPKTYQNACSFFFVIKKSVYLKIGLFDEKFKGWGFEDVEFFYRAKKLGYNLILDQVEKVYHISHKKQKDLKSGLNSLIRNANYFYKKWKNKEICKFLSDTEIGLNLSHGVLRNG